MNKYRYIKKYYGVGRDFSFIWKFSSLLFLFLGIVLVGNAAAPIISYQLTLSPQLSNQTQISPLVSGINLNDYSLASQVLGEETGGNDLTNVKNWFPEAPISSPDKEEVEEYRLSIPKLKIFDAVVKVGNENLDKSLVHYPGTARPGKFGNAVIFGHSVLPQFFSPKNYLTIFSTLPTIKKGDQILIDYDQIRYAYMIEELKEVPPNDSSILSQKYDDSHLTLVTCVPPGTYLRRLVVTARLTKI